MVKNAVGWIFHVVSVGFYLGTLAWCGIVGHERFEGGTRCRRCFERCEDVEPWGTF